MAHIVIHDFMVDELDLKGNELITYALIYGFSQDGESEYKGSYAYLTKWLKCSKKTAISAIHGLLERELIIKSQVNYGGVVLNHYKADLSKITRGVQKLHQGGVKITPGGEEITPNNIDDNIVDNKVKEDILSTTNVVSSISKKDTRSSSPKHKFGEYGHILLTDNEFAKLNEEYGEFDTQEAIKYLDEYIEMKGYKCKSHYLAIRKWVFQAVEEHSPKNKTIFGDDLAF